MSNFLIIGDIHWFGSLGSFLSGLSGVFSLISLIVIYNVYKGEKKQQRELGLLSVRLASIDELNAHMEHTLTFYLDPTKNTRWLGDRYVDFESLLSESLHLFDRDDITTQVTLLCFEATRNGEIFHGTADKESCVLFLTKWASDWRGLRRSMNNLAITLK